MRISKLLAAAVVLMAGAAVLAESTLMPKPKAAEKVEFTGKVTTGVMAIGGETTGTTIKVGDRTFELDLHGDKELTKKTESLNGKEAVVTGTMSKIAGVEGGDRTIVKVETIKAAPE